MTANDRTPMNPDANSVLNPVLDATRDWLEKAVIGLNLCPFAKAVHVKDQVRFVETQATTAEALALRLRDELEFLRDADPDEVDTTLLVHPQVLNDFLDYNDFLDVADELLLELELDGVIQVASFHPHYQFEGTDEHDIENFSNRSPYPTLHLLREASIDKAVEVFPDAERIYETNIETLRQLCHEGWKKLWVK